MNKEIIKDLILDQRESFFAEKQLIPREIQLDKYIKTRQIVVISGIRRCGKSSLLYLIRKKLEIPDKQCLYFNFEDERASFFSIDDFNKLYQLHLEMYGLENPESLIFFFDEIQNVEGWEKFLNRMYEKGIKIFITGSNARLMSSEIATTLTGRNVIINLYPFSFKEFLTFEAIEYDMNFLTTAKRASIVSKFNEYFKFGGFPLVLLERDVELIKVYYNDILYRDIIARYKVSHTEEIKQIALYLMSNCGKLFSYKILQNISGVKSLSSIKNYLEYLSSSFLFYYLKKFDYSVKKQILNPRKAYAADIALCSQIGFRFSMDYGSLLENIVYLELKRRGCDVFYHKGKKECDFVIREGLKITAVIQVTKNLSDFETKKREIAGLMDALNEYSLKQGLILTEDTEGSEKSDGKEIIIMPVWTWLLAYP